jgi:tRNA-uridine 2-sulfurtransferase
MNRKAIALISGGLDSALAIHLVKRLGIEIIGLHFTSFFSIADPARDDSPVMVTARYLDVPVIFMEKGDDFLEVLRHPRYGYGRNFNPCIDCRIYTLQKAKRFMEEQGASFLVTGEVLGQRPMSQRRDAMNLIEKRADCRGIVLRPLSAKRLAPTEPEDAGIVDRESLLEVTGRGRKAQFQLAADIGLTGYQAPAGGCLLTDPMFANRARDLLRDSECVSREDLQLLNVGRHVRIRPGLKAIVGRNHKENEFIEARADAGTLFFPMHFPGPLVLAQGEVNGDEEKLLGGILRRYAKPSVRGEEIGIRRQDGTVHQAGISWVTDEAWVAERLI